MHCQATSTKVAVNSRQSYSSNFLPLKLSGFCFARLRPDRTISGFWTVICRYGSICRRVLTIDKRLEHFSHTHAHARTHAHAHTRARVRTHTCAHARTHTRTRAHTRAHTRARARARGRAGARAGARLFTIGGHSRIIRGIPTFHVKHCYTIGDGLRKHDAYKNTGFPRHLHLEVLCRG